MIRGLIAVGATLALLAGAGHAQAQGFFGDSRDIMGGGPDYFGGWLPWMPALIALTRKGRDGRAVHLALPPSAVGADP